jgi:hypothetical protein
MSPIQVVGLAIQGTATLLPAPNVPDRFQVFRISLSGFLRGIVLVARVLSHCLKVCRMASGFCVVFFSMHESMNTRGFFLNA